MEHQGRDHAELVELGEWDFDADEQRPVMDVSARATEQAERDAVLDDDAGTHVASRHGMASLESSVASAALVPWRNGSASGNGEPER